MPLLTAEQTDRFLHNFYPLFVEVFNNSFREVQKHLKLAGESKFQGMHPRTKANIMWDYAVDYAIREFDKHHGVRLCKHQGAIGFLVEDQAFLRFKKLNKKLLSSNYPTNQATSMEGQTWELPEILESPTVLQIGYQVDDTWTKLVSVNIVCARNKKKLWDIDVLNQLGYTLDLFSSGSGQTDYSLNNFNLKPELKKGRKDGTNDSKL